MPVYASTSGFAGHRRHPRALLLIVGGHAVLIAAVMTAKMDLPDKFIPDITRVKLLPSDPPPPEPFDATSSSATLPRRDLVAALAREPAALAFFFFATDDARAEAPRPAIRLTVVSVALSVVFFLIAISFPASSFLLAFQCTFTWSSPDPESSNPDPSMRVRRSSRAIRPPK